MKALFFLGLVAFATAFDFPEIWEDWKVKHGKSYADETEEMLRHTIWQSNKKYVDEHNLHLADRLGFTLGMNEYADLENHEFVRIMNGYRMRPGPSNDTKVFRGHPRIRADPDVDWRKQGAVTAVKNQGQCGSCWAFSTTGSLEGQHFLKQGHHMVSLSEQNLVDCSQSFGNHGCEGGLMDYAFSYIKENHGIDTEDSYPYRARDGSCNFKSSDVGATDTGYVDVAHKDEGALKQAVSSIGPISVAIDASHASFQLYHSGVYNEERCSQTQLDHGVLAIGYGTDSETGKDYWLVKNSWGESWGMEGYIKMSRNMNNQCGIATQASYPTV